MRAPRVAYFPDSFHEVNGVAHTSRNLVAYAQRHELPFLCVRAGNREGIVEQNDQLRTVELRRSRTSVRLEKDLNFDPLFWRHTHVIAREMNHFQPDIIHITGPSELGMLGAYYAWKLGVPLAASWHTNVHEYAARRLGWLTQHTRQTTRDNVQRTIETGALWSTARFYRLAKVLFAPNAELCDMLQTATGRVCHLMRRGVDTVLFNPSRRTRPADDSRFLLGYVGRLSVEKNVLLLATIQAALHAMGIHNFQFVIVGHGDEEQEMRARMPGADFPGVLRGEALATAYANMDLLVFPSHTDTFGNVVLEALASGVPAIVTPDGGPKYIVRSGETGLVTSDEGFAPAIAQLIADPLRHQAMRYAARDYALQCSWDAVFNGVYSAYEAVRQPIPATVG